MGAWGRRPQQAIARFRVSEDRAMGLCVLTQALLAGFSNPHLRTSADMKKRRLLPNVIKLSPIRGKKDTPSTTFSVVDF